MTNRTEAPEVIWRDYNQRATLEQRIDELKSDPEADDFCRREFYTTGVFLCGGIAGTEVRTPVLNLSEAWGALEQRIPRSKTPPTSAAQSRRECPKQTRPPHLRHRFLPAITSPFDLQSRDTR